MAQPTPHDEPPRDAGADPGVLRGFASEDDSPVDEAPMVAMRAIVRRFWPWARPYRGWIALGLVFVVLVPAVEAIKIWMFKLVIDDVLVPGDFGPFWWIAGVYIGLVVLGGVLSFFDQTLTTWVAERFLLKARLDVFRHLHRISLVSLGRRKIGDLTQRLTGDISAIEGFLVSGLADAVAFVAEIVFFLTALFILGWDLTLVALVAVPLFWLAAARFSERVRESSREHRRRSGGVGAVIEESLGRSMLVRVFHREDAEVERLRAEGEAGFAAKMRSTRLSAAFTPSVEVIETIGALIVIGFGTWKLTQGQITIGGLLVFLTYLAQLYDPVRGLSKLAVSLHAAAAGAERVVELLDEPVGVPDAAGGRRLSAVAGELRFEHVSFRYDRDGGDVLSDVSVTLSPRTITTVVGGNGAGKSTLARLALRLQDPDDGRVLLDGVDVREFDLGWFHRHVAAVLQEALVVDGTIHDNIAFGRPDATDEQVAEAARVAGVATFAETLPDGLQTQVGERGVRLSGGQRQRIAIARALVTEAPIVVLDEPSTHLDGDSIDALTELVRELAETRTVLVVTHDPALADLADQVVRVERGRVVERMTRPRPLVIPEGVR